MGGRWMQEGKLTREVLDLRFTWGLKRVCVAWGKVNGTGSGRTADGRTQDLKEIQVLKIQDKNENSPKGINAH